MTRDNARKDAYLRSIEIVARQESWSARQAAATTAAAVAAALGLDVRALDVALLRDARDHRLIKCPADLAAPELLGMVFSTTESDEKRRANGIYYTPLAIARQVGARIVEHTRAHWNLPRTLDPAVGGGALLLGVAEELVVRGVGRAEAVTDLLFGFDVDQDACDISEAALAIFARGEHDAAQLRSHLEAADSLSLMTEAPAASGVQHRLFEQDAPPKRSIGTFEGVICNPPFGSPLRADSAMNAVTRRILEERFPGLSGEFADYSNLFVILESALTAPGGTFAAILPESFLVARGAKYARDLVLASSRPFWVWHSAGVMFDASVRVCALAFDRMTGSDEEGPPVEIALSRGPAFQPLPARVVKMEVLRAWDTWSELHADLSGVPEVGELRNQGVIGDWAEVSADFRDEFYALAGHVREFSDLSAPERASAIPITTVGLIDVAVNRWGRRKTRIAKREFVAPCVPRSDLSNLSDRLVARIVPKVMVATQTRVIEAVADPEGRYLPAVPVISVQCDAARAGLLAAALNSPVLSALAFRRAGGAAMSHDAIKLSARQVAGLPLPAGEDAWFAAAALLPERGVEQDVPWREYGELMLDAYGIAANSDVLEWWLGRLKAG